MVLLIGTVIYASSGNCVRQLRKGVTLDFPLCIHIYVFYCIVPVTTFYLPFHQLSRGSEAWSSAQSASGLWGSERLPLGQCCGRALLWQGTAASGSRRLCGVLQQVVGTSRLRLVFHLQGFLGGKQ